jgi:hypothetical protein
MIEVQVLLPPFDRLGVISKKSDGLNQPDLYFCLTYTMVDLFIETDNSRFDPSLDL